MSEIKVWNWNNFRGGLADSQYIGQEGCYQNGTYNIDSESEPVGVKLSAAGKDYLSLTGYPNIMYYGTNLITMCDDKSIACNNAITIVYNSTPATTMGRVYAAQEMYVSGTNYLFLFSSGSIHKAATNLTSVTYNVASPQAGSNIRAVNYMGDIYFTVNNIIYKYSNAEVLSTLFTAAPGVKINGITVFQDTMRVYGENGIDGIQYIFDISDFSTTPAAPSYVIDWKGLVIYGAANVGASDYVIAGAAQGYCDLYEVSGTQRIQIRGNTDGIQFRTFNSKIISRRDDCYIVGGPSATYTLASMFKYGTYFPGIQDTLTCPYSDNTYQIRSLASANLSVYIGVSDYTTGTTFKIRRLDLATPPYGTSYYATSGEIFSMIFDGGNRFGKKALKEIVISYDGDASHVVPKGGSFELYARIKNSGTWTKIGSTYNKTDVGFVRITENIIAAAGFSTFMQIELKLKLIADTSGGNNYYTPFITGVQLQYYDDLSTND